MKCHKCGKKMKQAKGLVFNQNRLDGWKCSCGEVYYDSEQAQRILLMNKLKKHIFRLRLSQVRSNLVLRIPKEVSDVLGLQKGEEVEFCLKDDDKIVINTVKI